eukprot:Rhum_TRINITY_DN24029_c0_g1::Rhum_TRINITY_DN24029_c0_g1_i1::g.179108::m.179108
METPDEITPAHPAFWDTFYDEGEGSTGRYEWFMEWSEYREHVLDTVEETTVTPEDGPVRMLHVGCGNSELPQALKEEWKGGAAVLISIDICERVILDMRKECAPSTSKKGRKKKEKEGAVASGAGGLRLDWEVGDCCKLEYADNFFHHIFDKGTVDALLSQCDDSTAREGNANCFAYFREAFRTLRPGGSFLLITINAPEVIYPYALGADGACDDEHSDLFNWTYETHTVHARAPAQKRSRAATVHSHGGYHTIFVFTKPL